MSHTPSSLRAGILNVLDLQKSGRKAQAKRAHEELLKKHKKRALGIAYAEVKREGPRNAQPA